MNKIIVMLVLTVLPFTFAFAQEKVVGDLSVKLGVISWEEIQASSKEKPAAHTEEFHREMAKSMMAMHGGGSKDTYQVMVMLSDKSTGENIKHADVIVTAVAKAGPEEITHKLQRMSMGGLSGFGEFYKLTLRGHMCSRLIFRKATGYIPQTLKRQFADNIPVDFL